MVRRALTRQTRWYQNRCSTFKIKDFIVQKPFKKILEFWPLVTSILTWDKKWPKWFRNDFSRAFERRFSFCSTMRRSRDRRGGVQTPPPPPSRWWKIQRPSRARVNTESYGLVVKVTPMLPYNCGPLPPAYVLTYVRTSVGVSYMKTLITRKRRVPGARNLDGRCSDMCPPVYLNLGPVRLTGWRQRVLACSIGLTLEMEKSKTAKNGPTRLGSPADCSATDGRSDMR